MYTCATKKNTIATVLVLLIVGIKEGRAQTGQEKAMVLWYSEPARFWTEALPLGNGQLGAMVFGGIQEELIQLNESTLWSGGPVQKNANPTALQYLPEIRNALWKEDYSTAARKMKHMQGPYTESYLPMGDVLLKQELPGGVASDYYRELNIQNGIAYTRFSLAGTVFTREVFTSSPDHCLVMRIRSSHPGKLNFSITAKSLLQHHVEKSGSNEIVLRGKAPSGVSPHYYNPPGVEYVRYGDTSGCKGMRFQYRIKAITKEGQVIAGNNGMSVKNATEVLVLITAATSFNGFNKCPDKAGKDEKKTASAWMQRASAKTYNELKRLHLEDFHRYFNRVSLVLTDTLFNNPALALPLNERLQQYSKGGYDPSLETLYFQYGRYLLICSSRPGNPPANLQGIWNKELRPPWSSNYTLNINTEMNYWPAEAGNLPEMHTSLLSFIENLSKVGKQTAKEYYGANGWVAHHNSDIWGLANAVGDFGQGDPMWANWYMGGNWLCRHLWEHYLFTGDQKFLSEKAYPIMKAAAEFSLDWLQKYKNGYLVTAPSTSPENAFRDKWGKYQSVSIASTMDMSVLFDLFSNLIQASVILQKDDAFRNLLVQKKAKLFPLQIGKNGQLQEWFEDFKEEDPRHRHLSHLYGLYPGYQISPISTPLFANAANKSLEARGDEGTGWSKAWKINFAARLFKGNHAYRLFRELLHYTNDNGEYNGQEGGTYPNLFDACPPFQIDGNFGGTAGVLEMLLQSHLGEIHILPALPDAWKNGTVNGLKARGAFEVNISWSSAQLQLVKIRSLQGGVCSVRSQQPLYPVGLNVKRSNNEWGHLLTFTAEKGKTYHFNTKQHQND